MTTIAVIGQGRLGKAIQDDRYTIIPVLRGDAIPKADFIVAALPGVALEEMIPDLLKIDAPVIIGSTGQKWPEGMQPKTPWIYGRNFSLAVQAMRRALHDIASLMPGAAIVIDETHQAAKKDSPSGTALLFRDAMNAPEAEIISHRIGESLPNHIIALSTPFEDVVLEHTAKNRDVYAQGILWLVDQLVAGHTLPAGLISFEDVFDDIRSKTV